MFIQDIFFFHEHPYVVTSETLLVYHGDVTNSYLDVKSIFGPAA